MTPEQVKSANLLTVWPELVSYLRRPPMMDSGARAPVECHPCRGRQCAPDFFLQRPSTRLEFVDSRFWDQLIHDPGVRHSALLALNGPAFEYPRPLTVTG
jgi:hypothetical protein